MQGHHEVFAAMSFPLGLGVDFTTAVAHHCRYTLTALDGQDVMGHKVAAAETSFERYCWVFATFEKKCVTWTATITGVSHCRSSNNVATSSSMVATTKL